MEFQGKVQCYKSNEDRYPFARYGLKMSDFACLVIKIMFRFSNKNVTNFPANIFGLGLIENIPHIVSGITIITGAFLQQRIT